MTAWPATLAVLVVLGCAAPPVNTLDGTVDDVATEPDAAVEAAVRPDAPAPKWWSDAPVCEPPEDASGWQEPDRRHCPALLFDPGPADVDAGMTACVPGRTTACMCDDGRRGVQACDFAGRAWGCSCGIVDAGSLWERTSQPTVALPPRLIRPLSGMRVTSRRPQLRWVLPDGVTRARVEVCADRPCARVIERVEVSGSSWRPTMRLPPGVVFWRVQGLSETGGVTWTSATWEFGVGRCDAERDVVLRPLRDLDGDGFDDAAFVDELATVGLLWGRPSGVAPRMSAIEGASKDLVTPRVTIGDINGDGLADLGVGYPGYTRTTDTTGDTPFADRRAVWGIYYGDRACGLRAEPARAGGFGQPAICDLDGDGFGEAIVVNRSGVGVFRGALTGLAGAPALELRFTDITNGFSTIRCEGDIDGDGYGDVLVTLHAAFDGDGAASVLYGAPDLRIDRRTTRIGSPMGGEFGRSARVTDLDADGFSDVVIGSYGRFWILRGTRAGLETFSKVGRVARSADENWCVRVVPELRVGDLDGDGRGDVLTLPCVGMSAFLSNGTSMTSEAPRWRVGSANGRDRMGSVSIPGDMNGDGRDDVLTAMATNDTRGPYTLDLHLLRGDGVGPPDWIWDLDAYVLLDPN